MSGMQEIEEMLKKDNFHCFLEQQVNDVVESMNLKVTDDFRKAMIVGCAAALDANEIDPGTKTPEEVSDLVAMYYMGIGFCSMANDLKENDVRGI